MAQEDPSTSTTEEESPSTSEDETTTQEDETTSENERDGCDHGQPSEYEESDDSS